MKNTIKTIGIFLAFCAYCAALYTAMYYFTIWTFNAVDAVFEYFRNKKEVKAATVNELEEEMG